MNTDSKLEELMSKLHTGTEFSVSDMKEFDKELLKVGQEPFFGWKWYMPQNVVNARIKGNFGTQGTINSDDYVCFDIWSKQTNRKGNLKISNELLTKVSIEDYYREEKKFPFTIEWSGKNSKIKQPCYYPTHREVNQNNPLPLKNLLFPEIKSIKYKKIIFLDGDRLHWSSNNIKFMTRKEYNNHPKKNELTILDEWVF